MRSKLVWKLSAAMVVILIAAIGLAGYVTHLISAHYSLQSARAFLRFNSESIINGIERQMMSRDNESIREMLADMSEGSTVYGDITLVSHHSGEVVASRFGEVGRKLELEDQACFVCHRREDLSRVEAETFDVVTERPGESRVLSVVAPIINEPGCRNAACHAHTEDPPILGFLNTDYSLGRVDSMVTRSGTLIAITVVLSLLLGAVALRVMFGRLVGKPLAGLVGGIERVAANQLNFRFAENRSDEFGVLQKSFNKMTARIQDHRDELRSTMTYLGGIVESSADIIVTVTPEGFIETFNRGAEEALGYSRAEVIGREVEMLFANPHDRKAALARLKDTDNVKNFETRFLTKEGKIRNVLLTMSRLRDRDGSPIGTIGISKDITQEKKLLRELFYSKKFAAIGQAVTGLQHAIKNMLNGLKGGAYLIRAGARRCDQEQIGEGLAMVEEGIERIGDLSHKMLFYAKEWKLDLQEANLNDVVRRVCELNSQKAADEGVEVELELPDDLPVVSCDPKLLHMALTDIVINAIDACAWKDYPANEEPKVVVKNSLGPGEGTVVIKIRDNGCGMNEDIRKHIFTPFFSTKKARGTGLGLAMTARIINVHGGDVSVESEPDRGTTFRIHLPIDGPGERREASDAQEGFAG